MAEGREKRARFSTEEGHALEQSGGDVHCKRAEHDRGADGGSTGRGHDGSLRGDVAG